MNKNINKNKFTIIIVMVALLVIIFDKIDSFTYANKQIKEVVAEENIGKEVEIYLYNQDKKDVELTKLHTNIERQMVEGDYINMIIENTPDILNSNIRFLAAYRYTDEENNNNMILLFNDNLMRLSEKNKKLVNNFLKSVNKTINSKYKNIDDLIIKSDTNN